MSLPAGTHLGPYEIVSGIGAGGMGEVYKAKDTRLDRTVAIKVLPSHVCGDPALRERFEREAHSIAALNHPHICTLYDVGRESGTDFLVLEYLEGQTLADRLAKSPLPLDQALTFAIQIADALDKAHRAGIVHRDLKPGNIMLTKSGAKLLDFGLAKVTPAAIAASGLSMAPTGVSPVTMHGTILGTLQYMAPEQAEGREADARCDIFTFGAIVYEMVTGQRAFQGKSQASVIAAILEREPPVMSSLQPLSPRALDHIINKCLAKDPEDRWQSAADVRSELKWVEGADEGTDRTPSNRRLRERAIWVLGVVASLAIVALSVPATLFFRRAVPEPVVTRFDVVTPSAADAFSFALSPDGRQLAFVADGGKGSQLWLRPLDQVKAQPLAGTDGALAPFWAPESHSVGFFADGKLKRIDLTGGVVQVLADAPIPRGGTWNPEDVIVFAPSSAGPLMRVTAAGGSAAPVTRISSGQNSHRWPQFLPDGRRFLFSMATGQLETRGVYVGSLDGGEPIRVLSAETNAAYTPPGYLLRVLQGVLVAQPFDAARASVTGEPIPVAQAVGTDDGTFHSAFSVSGQGVLAHRAGAAFRRQLVWIDRAGKTLGPLGSPDENGLSWAELAPDGQRVAVLRTTQGNPDVWIIDASRGVPSRFTFDVGIDSSPLWSPDGSRIVFRSTRNRGIYDLFEKPANGAADEQLLLATSQGKGPLDWSRDGRFLLYSTQDPKTQSDLWVLPMTGERKPFALLQSSFDEIEGQFSPDGRWLAYVSNESGRYEIYVRTFPQVSGKWQVSVGGGMQPRWRRDGNELFYVAPDARLMAVSIGGGSDGRTLEAGTPLALFATRIATGGNITATGFQARPQYAVAADGRFLINVAADDALASPITIVQNWVAALKK